MSRKNDRFLLTSLLSRATVKVPRDMGLRGGHGDLVAVGLSLGIDRATRHRKASLVSLCVEALQDEVEAFINRRQQVKARQFLKRHLECLYPRTLADFWYEMSWEFHGDVQNHGDKESDLAAFIELCVDRRLYRADKGRTLSGVKHFVQGWLGRPGGPNHLKLADPAHDQSPTRFSLEDFVAQTRVRPMTDEGHVNVGYLYRSIGDWFDISIDEASRHDLRVERAPFPDWAVNQLCRTEEHTMDERWILPRTMALHPAVSERLQSNHVFLAVMRSLWNEYRGVYGSGYTEAGAQVSEADRALSAAFFESLPSASGVTSLQ